MSRRPNLPPLVIPAAQQPPKAESDDSKKAKSSLTDSLLSPEPVQGELGIRSLDELKMIEDCMGSGCSGSVYPALHVPTGKYVAVKKMNVRDEAILKQLVHELRSLQRLRCPYVVSFYNCFYSQEFAHIVMEMMEVGSLADIVALNGPINEDVLAVFARHLVRGLAVMRQQKRVHRDIKPANICVNSQAVAKITDFGITGELESSLTHHQSFVGSSAYMAPERLLNIKYSFPSDLWSLGLSLLECALGFYPYSFSQDSFILLMESIARNPVPYVDEKSEYQIEEEKLSPLFKRFLKRCLRHDPKDRTEVKDLLDHVFVSEKRVTGLTDQGLRNWLQHVLVLRAKSNPKFTSIAQAAIQSIMRAEAQAQVLAQAQAQAQAQARAPNQAPKNV